MGKTAGMSDGSATPPPAPTAAQFAAFGQAFAGAVFTEDLLTKQLGSMLSRLSSFAGIPCDIPVVGHQVLPITGSLKLGKVTRTDVEPCQVPFLVEIYGTASVNGVAGIASFDLTLPIVFQPYAPAIIYIDIPPIDASMLKLDVSQWTALLGAALLSLGIAGVIADVGLLVTSSALPGWIAAALSSYLDSPAAVAGRTVDLLSAISGSQAAAGGVKPAGSATQVAPTLAAGQPAASTITVGKAQFYSLWLEKGEVLSLQCRAASAQRPGLVWSGVALTFDVLAPNGTVLQPMDSTTDMEQGTSVETYAWCDTDVTVFGRTDLRYTAHAPGLHMLRVKFPNEVGSKDPARYLVTWGTSHSGLPVSKICFDVFGENLLHHGITESLIAQAFAPKLPHDQKLTVFTVGDFSVDVTVTGTLLDAIQYLPTPDKADKELYFEPRVSLDLTLDVSNGSDHWAWKTTMLAHLRLRIHTDVNPAQIIAAFDPVAPTDVTVLEPPTPIDPGTGVVAAVKKAIGAALSDILPGQLAAQLQSQLTHTDLVTNVADAAAQVPPMAPIEVNLPPPFKGPATWQNLLPMGHSLRYPLRLADRQKVQIEVAASIAADKFQGPGAEVSFALVDSFGGIMATMPAGGESLEVTVAGKRSQKAGASFNAAGAGDYEVVVWESTPWGVEYPGINVSVTAT